MRAYTVAAPQEAWLLTLTEQAKPTPAADEVLVEVKAVGLNPVDYKLAMGGFPTWHYPHILGLDVAGVIAEIGPAVTGFQVGDRVAYHGNLTKPGGFADYALADHRALARIPSTVSFEAAAALPCAALTAYHILTRRVNAQKTRTVFVNGGAGGVGGYAVQFAALLGYQVFASASTVNHDYVHSLGASAVIDYKQTDLKKAVLELTQGVGVDVVIDTVSKATAKAALDYLAFSGHLISLLGQIHVDLPDLKHAFSISEVTLGGAYIANHAPSIRDLGVMLTEVLCLVGTGKCDPLLGQVLSMQEIPTGLKQLQTGHTRGKLVALWD